MGTLLSRHYVELSTFWCAYICGGLPLKAQCQQAIWTWCGMRKLNILIAWKVNQKLKKDPSMPITGKIYIFKMKFNSSC
jgi:hypothetical protein